MTTRQAMLMQTVHGMSYVRPDLVPATKWRMQRNMRFFNGSLVQTERKKIKARVENGHPHEMVHLGTLPTLNARRQIVFGLTKESAYYFSADLSSLVKMKCKGVDVKFEHTGEYARWDTTTYNGHRYFVNQQNTAKYTDGTEVFLLGGDTPAGRYIEVWYDHLVIGAPVIKGVQHKSRVAFSHLYNFEQFKPETTNEATTRDFTDFDTEDAYIDGVTGVKRLGNKLMVYTDSCVYAVDYVGMPHVINVNPIMEGTGNSLHYGVVTTKDSHYFFNVRNRQFYALNTSGMEQIGDDIAEFIFPMFDAAGTASPQVHGWHDSSRNEVWWAFNFDTSEEFNLAVVYNYRLKEWFVADLENIHSYCEVQGVATRFSDLSAPFDELGEYTIVELGAQGSTVKAKLWGGKYGRVYDEATTLASAVALSVPVLETGDFIYNSLDKKVETSEMGVNTSSVNVNVYIAARQQLQETVDWRLLGTWVPGQKFTFNYAKQFGRVLRFKFEPQNSGTLVETEVTAGAAGTTMQIFGTGFNGPVTALAVRSDGKIYAAGEFTTYRGAAAVGICRLLVDGTLDATFNPGTGFAPSATRIPPTQLEVDPDGGVWCALSTPRVVEAYTGRLYTGLYFQGSTRSTLIKLAANGSLAYEETDCNIAADISRFFGVQVDSDGAVYYAYATKGTSTGNLYWHHLVRKKSGDTTLRRIIKSSSGLASAIGDLALVGNQVFWSCPKALVGTYNDIADESGSSILTGTVWDGTLALSYFVLDKTELLLQQSWKAGAVSVGGYDNPVAFGWRVEKGGLNNVYAAHFPPPSGSFTDGRFGRSLEYQHRGLYQFNVGSKDVINEGNFYQEYYEFVGGGGGWIQYIAGMQPGEYYFLAQTSDWIHIGEATVTLYEDSGATKIIHQVRALGDTYYAQWLPFTLAGPGPYTLRIQASDVVQYSASLVYIGAIIRSKEGQQVAGITQPNAWSLQTDMTTAQADSGFTLVSETVDLDNTVWLVTPLTVISTNQDEYVYVVGNVSHFRGVEVHNSSMWAISNTGVLNEAFVLTLFNRWLSADGTQRLGKVFSAKPYNGKLLIAGRFTSISNVDAGHIGLVNPTTGAPVDILTVTEGTVEENVSTGTGSLGFEFIAYEQLIYTASAKQ